MENKRFQYFVRTKILARTARSQASTRIRYYYKNLIVTERKLRKGRKRKGPQLITVINLYSFELFSNGFKPRVKKDLRS